MTAESSILLLLSSEIVKTPQLVEEQVSKLSSSPGSGSVHHQLIERVSVGAVNLAANSYSQVFVADKPDSAVKLDQTTADAIFQSLIAGGSVKGHVDVSDAQSSLPFLLAGFTKDAAGNFSKPAATQTTASLKKKATSSNGGSLPKFKRLGNSTPKVGNSLSNIVTLNLDDDDDLIDENDLMADDKELTPAIVLPAKCDPGPGRKRRKACKDCTCGLKELEEQELNAQQSRQQNVVTLSSNDMAEVDFTVPGKAVGGCGSCALGDAFRCDGCPYLGLPPFKPGEVVSIAALRGDDL